MAKPTNPVPPEHRRNYELGEILSDFGSKVGAWFKDFLDLENGVDKEGTVISIRKNMRMRGASAWLLMASILVASIGLDQNSQAVIIGAMLISPLMSPILGVGLAIGINDKSMLWVSLQHFIVSIIIALFTSYIYFKFAPFSIGEPNDQIVARTKPNTLDVLIAFFGGVAGIISGSRKEASNAIPGVAIATALMPPLCVTGYGLAKWDLSIIANSFYLFFLNAVFVAIATYLIVRLLRFPERQYSSKREERLTQFFIFSFSILMIIPSSWILFKEIQVLRDKEKINKFAQRYFSNDLRSCFNPSANRYPVDSGTVVTFNLLGKKLQQDSIRFYELLLRKSLDEEVVMKLIQTEGDTEGLKILQDEIKEMSNKAQQLEITNTELLIAVEENKLLRNRVDSLEDKVLAVKKFSSIAERIYPDIQNIRYSRMQKIEAGEPSETFLPTLLVDWKTTIVEDDTAFRSKRKNLEMIFKEIAELDTLEVIVY